MNDRGPTFFLSLPPGRRFTSSGLDAEASPETTEHEQHTEIRDQFRPLQIASQIEGRHPSFSLTPTHYENHSGGSQHEVRRARTCGASGAVGDRDALEALPDLVDVLVAAACAPGQINQAHACQTRRQREEGGRKEGPRDEPDEEEAATRSSG